MSARLLPHFSRQSLPRYDLTIVAHQEFEQLELSNREVDRPSISRHFPRDDVEPERTDGELAIGASWPVQWPRMDRTFLLVGALAAFVGVALGAFGAHGLRSRLSPEMLAVFETGVRYQMYHALAILIVALAAARLDGWLIRAAGWLFTGGIVLFSGSLYALALSGVTLLGAVTPVGGLAFLAAWGCLVLAALRL